MSYDTIIRKLTDQGIPFTMHEHRPLQTVADMEEVLPFPKELFLKTLAFKIKNSSWLLVALRGQDQVDYRKIAAALGISRSHIIRPSSEEVMERLGMDQGGVCPIPTADNVRVVFDPGLLGMERVYCGGCRNDRTLEIRLDDLLRVSGATVQPIARDDAE